jgi:hypothetical protein
MILLYILTGAVILTLFMAKLNAVFQFRKKVKEFFAQSKNISHQSFHKSQLTGLPAPVQRYFNYTLKEGQPFISYVSMKHKGFFKTGFDKGWINIKGEQYATTEKPGFIWKGTTAMFTARDMYIADKGRLIVSLFSILTIADGKGEEYNQGELLRWLGESVLYPTNLLPTEQLQWAPIDETTAKLMYHYKGLSLFFKITFNEMGQITEMETKRFMNKTKLETWVIKLADYKMINSIIVPTAFEVLWRLTKGDFSYAKFYMTEITYNNPVQY